MKTAKHAAYLRLHGWSVLVPVGPAQTHLRWLHHTHGMTAKTISEQCTLSEASVNEIIAGKHYGAYGERHPLTAIRRENETSVLAVQPVTPSGRGGARVNACGSVRRVQALCARGFPVFWTSLQCGHDRTYFGTLIRGERAYIFASTAHQIRQVYEKYEHADPRDLGISERAVTASLNRATRNGYAPPAVWDWQTIDDPDGFPDWTGACGTAEGTELHHVEGLLPVCDPCMALWNSR